MTKTKEIPACVDCRHCVQPSKWKLLFSDAEPMCLLETKAFSPVTGWKRVNTRTCAFQRTSWGACGFDGKHWEARHD